MNKQQYAAFLACAVMPAVINTIAEKMKWDRMTTIERFYHSKVYALLEDESLKMWHYSPLTLCMMFESEINTGEIAFPEEAA